MPPKVRTNTRIAGEIIAIATIFFVGAMISLLFARADNRIAALWIPNAVMFVWLLKRPALARPDTFALSWAANAMAGVLFGDSLVIAAMLASSNTAEVMIALALSRRAGLSIAQMGTIEQQIRLFAFCGITAPAVSATIASLSLGWSNPAAAPSIWVSWFITDCLGMTLIASTLGVIVKHISAGRRIRRADVVEWTTLTLAGTALTVGIFAQSHLPLLFMATPVVVLHAVRHGILGTAISTLKIAIISITATALGSGPIMLTQDPWLRLVILQLFLLSVFAMGIPIAALLRREQSAAFSLRNREAQSTMVSEGMSDALLAFDGGGLCSFATGSVHALTGLPANQLIGSHASDLVASEDKARMQAALEHIRDADETSVTITYRCPEASPGSVETFVEAKLTSSASRAAGEQFKVIATLRDVTERVALERELVESRERAELAVLAKSQFLANMSHEIRTPMNGVLGFAELLEQRLEDPAQRRQAWMIVQSGQSMMQLLNDILDLSKVEVGLVTISDDVVNLRSLMDECVSLNTAQAANKSVSLNLAMAPGLPQHIWCDPLRVRQILLNLMGNAIKFTDRGSVSVSVAALGNRLRILVRDTGVGIPSERLQAIFLPFEQGDNAISRRYGGTGLGLAISRQLAELMEGQLDVSSILGQGSCFSLEIPLRVAHESAQQTSEALIRPFQATAMAQARQILLVDDQEINRELAGAMLHQLGQSVVWAANGREAIEAVEEAASRDQSFDLVLMDIQMPVCDGYQASRELRRLGYSCERLPIVAMTANGYPEDVRMALDNGMQDHLSKPITLARLDAVLARWGGRYSLVPEAAPAVLSDERIARMWLDTRSAALESARHWLRDGSAGGGSRQKLQAAMHRIAGTALHFGEGPFGDAASKVDRAIAEGAQDDELRLHVGKVIAIATDTRLLAACPVLGNPA